jgi:DNA-directed RNA polymerase alpha subunit
VKRRTENGACGRRLTGDVRASHNEAATAGDAGFAIPESVHQLQLEELPITTRLANVARSIGARALGDLSERSPSELLQYKDCGVRTLDEVRRLLERAISGEFDEAEIRSTPPRGVKNRDSEK